MGDVDVDDGRSGPQTSARFRVRVTVSFIVEDMFKIRITVRF